MANPMWTTLKQRWKTNTWKADRNDNRYNIHYNIIFWCWTSMLCRQNIRLSCLSVEKRYCIRVIWFFGEKTKADILSWYNAFCKLILCWCYIKRCWLPHPLMLCRLCPFLMVKNTRDLVRNFLTQIFASSHPLLSMISDESKWKRLIASHKRCWTKKAEDLEICCF